MTAGSSLVDTLRAELQTLLERARPHLRPSSAAALQERIWELCDAAVQAARSARPAPPPTVTRPRALPKPLNPFYFARAAAPK